MSFIASTYRTSIASGRKARDGLILLLSGFEAIVCDPSAFAPISCVCGGCLERYHGISVEIDRVFSFNT